MPLLKWHYINLPLPLSHKALSRTNIYHLKEKCLALHVCGGILLFTPPVSWALFCQLIKWCYIIFELQLEISKKNTGKVLISSSVGLIRQGLQLNAIVMHSLWSNESDDNFHCYCHCLIFILLLNINATFDITTTVSEMWDITGFSICFQCRGSALFYQVLLTGEEIEL